MYIMLTNMTSSVSDGHPDTHSELSSPSLPLQDVQGDTEEYIFLLIECLRATIEGMGKNKLREICS